MSPQTTVVPGWVRPSCGPTTWTTPCSTSPSECSRTPNSAQFLRSVSSWARETGSAIGLSMSRVGVLWSSVAMVRSRRRTLRPACRRPVEGLRAGHLVQQVQIDEEEVGLALGAPDDMVVPDLLRECPTHRFPSGRPLSPALIESVCRTPVPTSRTRLGPVTRDPHSDCASWKIELAFHSVRREYRFMDNSSGVGVLDKAALVLSALESGPATLAGLVAATRARTTHGTPPRRGTRTPPDGGEGHAGPVHPRPAAGGARRRGRRGPPAGHGRPVLTHLRDVTGESAQLYRRQGDMRICVAAAERLSGLRDTVPVGSTLPMKAGSAAQILMAWEEPERLHRGLQGARFTATALSGVRRRGWAQSIGEREPGVASVSAPVRGPVEPRGGRRVGLRTDRAADPPPGADARPGRHRRGRPPDGGPAPLRLTSRPCTTPRARGRAATPHTSEHAPPGPHLFDGPRGAPETAKRPSAMNAEGLFCAYPRPDSNRRYRLERAAC